MLGGKSKYVPIGDLSCFTRFPRGQLMIIRSYFDSSGNANHKKESHITLAGFSATKDEWDIFEKSWESVLKDHKAPLSENGCPYWHSVEAFHLRKGYKKDNGWTDEKVQNLAFDLLQALGDMPNDSLCGFGASLKKRDYNLAKQINPKMMNPFYICLNHCFSAVIGFVEKKLDDNPMLELYFDENEPFEPIITKLLNKGIYWKKYIEAQVRTFRMRHLYPLQACDLLAWLLNRYNTRIEEDINDPREIIPAFNLNVNSLWIAHYDSENLRSAIDKDGNYHYEKVKPLDLGCEARNAEKLLRRFLWNRKSR